VITANELVELAKRAETTINYAFDEPYVAISAKDALLIAERIREIEAVLRLVHNHLKYGHPSERVFIERMLTIYDLKESRVE
jgi:hypothetical protein